ncbi:hypothetical protein H6F43_03225 [Leptolyngbya sp. FACHB-36]|uniref:hypothetical protein n=1 Tax=Leptolyngbya sp. FACHB-36 TaxID=2692808 RepID=UPI0016819158|nr:hypothetical protein [Leptolyngbya sp. FACHB-36]MBD2019195.1 hypothetical protein [Leptolyngbya sp. FACHB-36]
MNPKQLELFSTSQEPATDAPERWRYPMVTLFHTGSSNLYYIVASSKEEARTIAEGYLRQKQVPYKSVACLLGTYWRESLDGYPCSPVNQCDRYC